MSKETTYTCDLCEQEGNFQFVVGVKHPTLNAVRADLWQPDGADKHVCRDCIRLIRCMREELIPTGGPNK